MFFEGMWWLCGGWFIGDVCIGEGVEVRVVVIWGVVGCTVEETHLIVCRCCCYYRWLLMLLPLRLFYSIYGEVFLFHILFFVFFYFDGGNDHLGISKRR